MRFFIKQSSLGAVMQDLCSRLRNANRRRNRLFIFSMKTDANSEMFVFAFNILFQHQVQIKSGIMNLFDYYFSKKHGCNILF